MGLEMDLEFDKYCIVDGSPNTVLPSPRPRSKVEGRKANGKPKCGNDLLSLNKEFTEIDFHRYRSASCKNVPSKTILLEGNELLKRGSVYQSSQEVRMMKKKGDFGGRRKIGLPRSSATAFSFGIVDSLCSSDEDSSLMEPNRSSAMSLNSESSTSVSKNHSHHESLDLPFQPVSERGVLSNSFSRMFLGSDGRVNQSAGNVESPSAEDSKIKCYPAAGPLSHSYGVGERDPAMIFHKSLSAKLALPHSPCHSESDCSKLSSPKSRFSPIRKMLDPFSKSKSLRSPLSSVNRPGEVTPFENDGISRSRTSRKSLLHDFSNAAQNMQHYDIKKEYNKPLMPCSPTHLRGFLKLETKQGLPFFEFSVKNAEDNLIAKTWRMGNALNWVYTFHTAQYIKKSNANGRGLKESKKNSSMVGQMQVSCFLCAELKDVRVFGNSLATEFVLYDIGQARKCVSAQNSLEVAKLPKHSNETSKEDVQPIHASEVSHKYLSLNPVAAADLHPNLEIAAIVIQVPFENRESLKGRRGDEQSDQPLHDSLDLSEVDQRSKGIQGCVSPAMVNVVTPSGNHSLPTTESPGPSALLERWRLGGGCDCGGWDMGCPLLVFGNSGVQCAKDHALRDNQQPWKLYVQGAKEKTAALTMTATEEGEYEVDFHAQLTTLQAFSICVAILHSTEPSIAVGPERDRKILQCDSLRVFIDEDVKCLIESITEEDKRKENKKAEVPQSFVLNPPFSPIARV